MSHKNRSIEIFFFVTCQVLFSFNRRRCDRTKLDLVQFPEKLLDFIIAVAIESLLENNPNAQKKFSIDQFNYSTVTDLAKFRG
jgi:hypothetical protein